MSLGKRILRFFHPEGEKLRQEFRDAMAMAQANCEEVDRTVIMDGAAIRAAIRQHIVEREAPTRQKVAA